MARFLKQSTSADVPVGPFVDATDGFTAETALTITQPDVRLKKNAAAWAQKAAAQTLSHEENGYYEVTLDATDTDTLGLLRMAISETGARPVMDDFLVVPANIYDSLFSTDLLQIDLTQIAGVAVSTSTAQLGVNAVQAAGTAWGSGAITAASIAADAGAEIADAVWDEDATGHQTQGTFGQAIGDPVGDTGTLYKAVVTDASGATIGVDSVAIRVKTDQLSFTNANQVDANIQAINDVTVTGNGSSTPFDV